MRVPLLAAGLCMLALLLYTPHARADIFRWKDAEGRVHFGGTPPAGVKAERWNPSGRDRIQRAPGTSAPPVRRRASPATHRPYPGATANAPERLGGQTEAQWRAKAAVFNSRIEALERQIDSLKSSPSVSGYRSSFSYARAQARREERIERVKKQIEEAEDQLEALEDEARKSDVPPGWLR